MTEDQVEKVMKKLIVQLLEFPQAHVCKHWAACNILSEMEQMGFEVTEEMTKSLIESRDGDALNLFKDEKA